MKEMMTGEMMSSERCETREIYNSQAQEFYNNI